MESQWKRWSMQEALRTTVWPCVHMCSGVCGADGKNSVVERLSDLFKALSLTFTKDKQTNPQNKNDWAKEPQETTVWFQHIFFSWLHIHYAPEYREYKMKPQPITMTSPTCSAPAHLQRLSCWDQEPLWSTGSVTLGKPCLLHSSPCDPHSDIFLLLCIQIILIS